MDNYDTYVPPHLHLDYSNNGMKDSVNTIDNVVKRLKEIGATACAVTDHGTTSGIVEAYKKFKKAGIKLIPGYEGYLTGDLSIQQRDLSHITLWAKDSQGLRNLYEISTIANGDKGRSPNNYYYKPRVDLELLRRFSAGIMAGSACLGGCLVTEDYGVNEDKLQQLIDIYGADDVFLEIHTYQCPEQFKYNHALVKASKKFNVRLIVATDAHFAWKYSAELRKHFKNTSKTQEGDENIDDTLYIQDVDEIRSNLRYLDGLVINEAIANTHVLAEKSNVEIAFNGKHYPEYKCENPLTEVRLQAIAGWNRLVKGTGVDYDAYAERVKFELNILDKQDYCSYFLINSGLIKKFIAAGIPVGDGRGSVVASMVAWLLGITKLDPYKYNLVFERFAHMERLSPPDVDTDISKKHRHQCLEIIKEEYGETYQCRTFARYGASGSIRQAGKALFYPLDVVDALAKSLSKYESDDEDDETSTYDQKIWMLDNVKTDDNADLIELAKQFVGICFGYGKHASAIIVLTEDVLQFCSVERQKDSKTGDINYILACDFKLLEEMGLMKLDMLGLKTLDVIQDTLDMLSVPIDIETIPLDDEATSQMLCEGKTKGCFQISSPGMTQLVKGIQPKNFADMIPLVSLYRPGPLDAIVEETGDTMVDTYVKVKNGEIEATYLHEKLRPILSDTYGIILYQEQILEIIKELCGYSLGEADMFRRIIGKKKVDEMKPAIEAMIERGVIQGIPRPTMESIADRIVTFAMYGFNKCLSGDERLHRPANGKFMPTLSEMWMIKNSLAYAKETKHKELYDKYNAYGYGTTLSMFDDGNIKKNTIVDIVPSGTAAIYRLTTKTGKIVDCTMNHKLPTPQGGKILYDLKVGSEVYVIGDYEITSTIYNFYNGNPPESNVPKAGQQGFQRNPYGASTLFDTAREFFSNIHAACEDCGTYDAKKYELHHVNMNRQDNSNENLRWLCVSCHRKAHYAMGRTKVGTRGSSAAIDTIASIEYLKTTEVFDVTMEAPAHNFVNLGGVVVSNSHSAAYGKLAYKTSYLKAHYPLQYMCACINNEEGKQDKILPFIKECGKLEITVLPPDITLKNRQWIIQGDSLVMGLHYIKGVGNNLRLDNINSYDDIVRYNAKDVTTALIKSGAMDSYGDRGVLLDSLESLQDTMKRIDNCMAKVKENSESLALAVSDKDIKKYARQKGQWEAKLSEAKAKEAQVSSTEFYDKVIGEIEVLGYSEGVSPTIKVGKVVGVFSKVIGNGSTMGWVTLKSPHGEFRCACFSDMWDIIKDLVVVGSTYKFVVKSNDRGDNLEEISINGVTHRKPQKQWAKR